MLVDHDARLAALAETWNQNGDFPKNFAYLLVREGLGVGLVIAGQVYRGNRHHGSEFGHVTLDPRGPRCECGRRGCWEVYVSERVTLDRYSHSAAGARCPDLAELVELALQGDRAARMAVTTTGFYLARGIANLSWALNVDQIIIGGELSRAWAILEPAIRKGLDRNPLPVHVEQLPITVSRFGEAGPLRGAIALALGRYIRATSAS
jgi:predicted NBD/HSP70 family sugar kinase